MDLNIVEHKFDKLLDLTLENKSQLSEIKTQIAVIATDQVNLKQKIEELSGKIINHETQINDVKEVSDAFKKAMPWIALIVLGVMGIIKAPEALELIKTALI